MQRQLSNCELSAMQAQAKHIATKEGVAIFKKPVNNYCRHREIEPPMISYSYGHGAACRNVEVCRVHPQAPIRLVAEAVKNM